MDEDAKEGKDDKDKKDEKGLRNKKLLVFFIVINILLVSLVVVWYTYLRPWSIREVAWQTGYEDEEELAILWGNPDITNPGFSRDLAGREITVKGQVTDIMTILTTLGPLTYYELDDFTYIRLIEWRLPRYSIGDEIEKKISFEWGQWNDQKNVYSPQLDFPAIGRAPTIEIVIGSVSCAMGLIMESNQTEPDGPVNVSVFSPWGLRYPLELVECSLRAGTESHTAEYLDASGGYADNPVLDTINTLFNDTGENGILHFTDANQNALFDSGDYFSINLSIPESDNTVRTYLLSINSGVDFDEDRAVRGTCYIVMTNRGILSCISTLVGDVFISPHLTTELEFQYGPEDVVTTIIEVEHVMGETPEISDATCRVHFEGNVLQSTILTEGEVLNQDGIVIEFSDGNDNALLDTGDRLVIQGFENHTGSEFRVVSESIGTSFISINWITGIGISTGNLPLLYYGEPTALSELDNDTYKIEIENMFGRPGIDLSLEDQGEWFVIRAEKDDQEILPSVNLTPDFKEEQTEVNITFIDADENEFINAGDHFLCRVNGSGEYQLILDYVEEDRWNEIGYEVLISRSASWTV